MTTHEEAMANLALPEYNFLWTHPSLGDNIILFGLGGSRAYGTDNENSDWDWRGIATRSAQDILVGRDWEQVTHSGVDATVYSLDKIIKLLSACNPNTIEMLGLKPEHYAYVSPAGQALIDNRDMFLSKKAVHSFGGYARAQLNRLVNASGRALGAIASNETRSLQNAVAALKRDGKVSSVTVYEQDGVPTVHISEDMPIDRFMRLAQTIDNVHTDYRPSTRNNNALAHGKLGKHQMHLVRLYLMAFDILEKGEINTFRDKEHDLLMDIRNGKYLTEDGKTTREFAEMLSEWEARLQKDAQTSELPNEPDYERICALQRDVNESVIFHQSLNREER